MKDILPELENKEYTAGIYEDYDIRFCKEDEYDDLKTFLKKYWKENHIFVLCKEIFDFQHLDSEKHRYNYVIAREKKSGDIHSVLGFVPTSQFDKHIDHTMVWPCIWKSRKDINRKGLGVTMYHFLKSNINIETISILGISEIALSIYKHWNFQTGKIEQYVMPNFAFKEHLAMGLTRHYSRFVRNTIDTLQLSEIAEEEYEKIDPNDYVFQNISIYKSKEYYLNRFFKHPIYKYQFLQIKDGNKIMAILVVRACGDNISKCLRIVDYIGRVDYMIGVKNQLQNYLQKNLYEYIDFVEVGIDSSVLMEAGFVNRREYKNVIVPNYFEPFLQENVDLDYAYKTIMPHTKAIFFKADADQDRPNIISNLEC